LGLLCLILWRIRALVKHRSDLGDCLRKIGYCNSDSYSRAESTCRQGASLKSTCSAGSTEASTQTHTDPKRLAPDSDQKGRAGCTSETSCETCA
jgi:hypothetical protein